MGLLRNILTSKASFFRFYILIILFLFATSSVFSIEWLLFSPINANDGLSDNQVRYILQLTDGRMVFTTSGNVNIYDGANFKYLHRTKDDIFNLSKYDGHYRIYNNNDSLLWIKDYHKLFCIDLYNEKYISNLDSLFEANSFMAVEDIFLDNNNRLWILETKILTEYNSKVSIDASHRTGKLQDLFSNNNEIYLFFDTGELACYDIETEQFIYSKKAYSEEEISLFNKTSLVLKSDNFFYQVKNGSKGGFFIFDIAKREWKKIFEENIALNTLILANNNTAFISTQKGVLKIDLTTYNIELISEINTTKGVLTNAEISTLFYDNQGGFWLGTLNRGLLYFHPDRFNLQKYSRGDFNINLDQEIIVEAFAENELNEILIRTNIGFFKIDDNNSLSKINEQKFFINHISPITNSTNTDFEYNCLVIDKLNQKWFGTNDGLLLFDKEMNYIRTFYMEDGLVNNFIHGLLQSKNGDLWVSTSNGISHIKNINNEFHFTNYTNNDGTVENEYINNSIFESSDGRIFFGAIDGFNIIDPIKKQINATLPNNPLFTNLYLFGEKVKVGEAYNKNTILNKSPSFTSEITLNYNQNFVGFEFSALNYRNPYQTFYQYKLEGFDVDWQETLASKTSSKTGLNGNLQISYTNIPPGNYLLKIKTSDRYPEWENAPSKVIAIKVKSPWWANRVSYSIYFILSLILLFTSIYIYNRITKQKLERKHKEETLLLRIRDLINQVDQYENVKSEEEDATFLDNKTNDLNENESKFITDAIALVERNLTNSSYSVEQLSKDLYMERTGLYKKLTSLLDQSPSIFIRNIRLQKASQLIIEQKHSITEIAEIVGFNSSSYFSKCFYEMYQCKPSEYAEKMQKST